MYTYTHTHTFTLPLTASPPFSQLRYAGLFEAIRIRKSGYAYRASHEAFVRTYSIIDPAVHGMVVPPSHSRITLNDRGAASGKNNKTRGGKGGPVGSKASVKVTADDDDDDDYDEYFNRGKKVLDFEQLAGLLIKAAATMSLIAEGMGFVGVTRVFVKEMGHMNAMDRRLAVLNEPYRIRIQAFCRMVTERCRFYDRLYTVRQEARLQIAARQRKIDDEIASRRAEEQRLKMETRRKKKAAVCFQKMWRGIRLRRIWASLQVRNKTKQNKTKQNTFFFNALILF